MFRSTFFNVVYVLRFGLRAGPGVLAGISGISSMVILNHFRKKLKLGMHGRVTSYLPVVAMPCALSALFHVTVSNMQNDHKTF